MTLSRHNGLVLAACLVLVGATESGHAQEGTRHVSLRSHLKPGDTQPVITIDQRNQAFHRRRRHNQGALSQPGGPSSAGSPGDIRRAEEIVYNNRDLPMRDRDKIEILPGK